MSPWEPVPSPAPGDEERDVVRMDVDGEEFDVSERPDRTGEYHFDWVSGPNAGYGFTTATSDHSELDQAELEEAIREFLAMVDPETGYIE
ncbi:MAG TPA: hypothetical protein VH419_09635 [Nocardioidaceae bacterium]